MNRGFTSFRALSFLAVFLFHSTGFTAGYLGVQAFFVLSGFLLTPILVDMKSDLDTRSFFINFYGRRALRIFPLYYLYLFVVGLICLVIVNMDGYVRIDRIERYLTQMPWALTYTYNFFVASVMYKHTHLVSHFWSLAIEEQFYLLWPLFIFFLHRRYLKTFLLAIIILAPIFRLIIGMIAERNLYPLLHNQDDLVVYMLPLSHFDAFAMGGFFALFQSSKPRFVTWVLVCVVAMLGYTTQAQQHGTVELLSLGYPPFMKDNYVWGYSAVNLLFAFVLTQIRDRKFLPVVFENGILHYMGKISYGLYVYHFPILWAMSYFDTGLSIIAHILLSLLLTIAISTVSYEYYEKRFIDMKDRFFYKEP
jgi:peptidoglycan/LPS O-acetylase OafA/YrhL